MEEMLNKSKLERLLRDSYANYVVQTALDYAEPAQRLKVKIYMSVYIWKLPSWPTLVTFSSLLNVFDHCYLLYATHLMANASRVKSTVKLSDRFHIILISMPWQRWVIWLRTWHWFHHQCHQRPLELSVLFQCSIIIESACSFIFVMSFNHCTISSKKTVYT